VSNNVSDYVSIDSLINKAKEKGLKIVFDSNDTEDNVQNIADRVCGNISIDYLKTNNV